MNPNVKQILIESILGGHSNFHNFASSDEYQSSMGIDYELNAVDFSASGYIIPSFVSTTASFSGVPMWMEENPKDAYTYVYDSVGSIYTLDTNNTLTGLTDLNDGGTAQANGLSYYDNYIYAARSTTVARYGPLNGTASWTDDYWSTTLSKTALSDTAYPLYSSIFAQKIPNHVMLRHTDGKLYFGDVADNQGVLHCISTTKTTVEGDTDDGSAYNVVDFPYGMYPTAIASYGDLIAIALVEANSTAATTRNRAKIIFWNPSNPNTYDRIIDSDYPDTIITAMLNSNGVLYTFSCAPTFLSGTRICRYVGGNTFEQVSFVDYCDPPFPGAVKGYLNKILFGTRTTKPIGSGIGGSPTGFGGVISIGTSLSPVSKIIRNIVGLQIDQQSIVTTLSTTGARGVRLCAYITSNGDKYFYSQSTPGSSSGNTGFTNSVFVSQTYRLGSPYKIKKISFDLPSDLNATDTYNIQPIIRKDDNSSSQELTLINYSSYPSTRHIVLRPGDCSGKYNFNLELRFSGTGSAALYRYGIALPIKIEYEDIDD